MGMMRRKAAALNGLRLVSENPYNCLIAKELQYHKDYGASQQIVVDSSPALNIMDSIAATHKEASDDFR
jgi:hypothetical protein